MISKSFRKGFVGGFTSPVNLFSTKPITRPKEFDGSVKRAWESVGQALSKATKRQGEVIGKSSDTTKTGKSGKSRAA